MKPPTQILSFALSTVVTALILSCVPPATAQSTSVEDPLHGRRHFNVPPGDFYTGRSPFTGGEMAPAAPKPARVVERPAAPIQPAGGCEVIDTGWVHMTKTMPREVLLGQEFMYELNPRAMACVGNVVVTEQIPAGTTYIRSEPKAELVGDRLVWQLGDMDPGQTIPLKVWVRADREGEVGSCATVSADPRLCARTFVGRPLLAIEKTGPETAQLNSDVAYDIVVANRGNAVARNVVVTDDIPEGLTHAGGQKQLTFNVGELPPNQSKTIPVTLKATQRGKFCNTASAVADNVPKVSDDACTTVVQPGLKVVKTGDERQLINKTANYQIKVSNVGDTDLTGVVVTDTAPSPTEIVTAQDATVSGNTATWNVGTLPKGAEKTFNVSLTSKVPGNSCNGVSVATAQGLRESAQACTEWIGVTGVLVEVVDDPDPIQVNDFTTFTIRVTNQGSTRNIEDISVKATFQAQADPVSASNGGTVSGKNVSWPVLPTLAPKASVTYTLRSKGVAAGDHRLEVQVTTRMRENPIVELESTTVY